MPSDDVEQGRFPGAIGSNDGCDLPPVGGEADASDRRGPVCLEVVFSIAQKIAVLHQGRMIAEGRPEDVRRDPEVRRVYLGHVVLLASAIPSSTCFWLP